MSTQPALRRSITLMAAGLAGVAAPLALGLSASATTGAHVTSTSGQVKPHHHAKDSDHDGMPDRWEKRFHLAVHRANAKADRDHDGLSNLGEFRHHTSPLAKDTDGDGLGDDDEVTDGTPTTDPTEVDTDDDGTNDGLEDADGDGIDNEDEAEGCTTTPATGADPSDPCDDEAGDDSGGNNSGNNAGGGSDNGSGDDASRVSLWQIG